jgi:DNA-binding PadR family transcriptional regulator
MIPDDYFLSICKKNQTIQIDIRQLIDDKPTKNGILLSQRQWEYIQRLRQIINQHIRRINNLCMK